jgi:maleylacetate reductase
MSPGEGGDLRAFTYDALPGRVVFGAGASRDELVEEVGRLDSKRVLFVATEGPTSPSRSP